MNALLTAVRRAWRSLGDPGLVVAVSGGPDSVALLLALLEVRPSTETPLVVAHLNHLLRGEESERDEAFVIDLHARLSQQNVQLAHHRLDIAALARQEQANLEATARRERYAWLASVARTHGLRHIATGHTANDQAETVLHRLLRGTGLDGLRGIGFRREIEGGIEIVRPMLASTRQEVIAYLGEIGQIARHDASNDDRQFTRNRLRHELLPLLAREYNPRIVEVLARLAGQADEAFEAEQEQAQDVLTQVECPRAEGVVVLNALALRAFPRRLIRSVLRLIWRREGWPRGEMGHEEYERLADLVQGDSGAWDLPGGIRARRRGAMALQLGPAT